MKSMIHITNSKRAQQLSVYKVKYVCSEPAFENRHCSVLPIFNFLILQKQEMKDAQRHGSHHHTPHATSSQYSTNSRGAASIGRQASQYGEPIRDPRSLSRGSSPRSSGGGSRKRALPQLPQQVTILHHDLTSVTKIYF